MAQLSRRKNSKHVFAATCFKLLLQVSAVCAHITIIITLLRQPLFTNRICLQIVNMPVNGGAWEPSVMNLPKLYKKKHEEKYLCHNQNGETNPSTFSIGKYLSSIHYLPRTNVCMPPHPKILLQILQIFKGDNITVKNNVSLNIPRICIRNNCI